MTAEGTRHHAPAGSARQTLAGAVALLALKSCAASKVKLQQPLKTRKESCQNAQLQNEASETLKTKLR